MRMCETRWPDWRRRPPTGFRNSSLPVAIAQLEAGRSVKVCAAVVASWARYAEGRADDGASIDVVDRLREQVVRAAVKQGDDPLSFLRMRDLFGDLIEQEAFTVPYVQTLQALRNHGARAVISALAHK